LNTNVVLNGAPKMRSSPLKSPDKKIRRLSISLSDEQHAELLAIARKNRVSAAWVAREAIERLLADDLPLFHLRRPT